MAHIISHAFDADAKLPFRAVKYLEVGRNGHNDHHNEDRVLIHHNEVVTVLAAIDGITPLTAWRTHMPIDGKEHPVSAAWLAKQAVARNLVQLDESMSFADLLVNIVEDWNYERAKHGLPENDILGAVFCAYVKFAGQPAEIWQLGDCGWGFQTTGTASEWKDSLGGVLPENSTDANVRAESILLDIGAQNRWYPQDFLGEPKLMRDIVHKAWKTMREKRKRDSVYDWLSDADKMANHWHVQPEIKVPDGISKLVLTTDGMLIVPQTIEAGLAFLDGLREEDPMMIGTNTHKLRTAKGFVDMHSGIIHPYTDDLGMIEVAF